MKLNREAFPAGTQECTEAGNEFIRDQRSNWWLEKHMAVNVWTKAYWWTFSHLFSTIVKISNSVTRFSRCWLPELSWNSQISHSPLIQHGEKSCCCTFLFFGPLHSESATKYHNFSYISRKIDRIWIRQQQLFREGCCGHFETLHDFLASLSDSASWRLVIRARIWAVWRESIAPVH